MDIAWLIAGVTAGVPLVALIYAVGRSRQQIIDLAKSVTNMNNNLTIYCSKNDADHDCIKRDIADTKSSVSTAAGRISRIEGYMNGTKNEKAHSS